LGRPALCLEGCADHPDLRSFPTRRSSDLSAAQTSTESPTLPTTKRSPGARSARATSKAGHSLVRPSARSTIARAKATSGAACSRSEEHTSELQSLTNLVCRLLLEKKTTLP